MAHFDLVIVGAGSGNSLLTPELAELRVAIIERADFGGTCLNRGCIPSKMLVHTADVAQSARGAARLGIDARVDAVRWGDISQRVFGRIDPIASAGEDYRRASENVTVYKGRARFVGPRTLRVDADEIGEPEPDRPRVEGPETDSSGVNGSEAGRAKAAGAGPGGSEFDGTDAPSAGPGGTDSGGDGSAAGGPGVAGARSVEVSGDVVVLAAGARPFVPATPDLSGVPYHTSDSIMRLEAPPERLLIWGGGYIAAEMAHVFGAAGSEVVIINRGPRLLRAEDDEVSEAFTAAYRSRFEVLTGTTVLAAAAGADGEVTLRLAQSEDEAGAGAERTLRVAQSGGAGRAGGEETLRVAQSGEASGAGGDRTLTGDVLLLATGRVPNGDELEVEAAGVQRDSAGYVVTDEFGRTTAPGVWALGDIRNPMQLKHVANAEARAVAHNLAYPDDLRPLALGPIPHAVFASPQVASVGATERALGAAGHPYVRSVRPYSDTAYGWAMEDGTGFCKLLADPAGGRLLGAHILGPHAAILIQQLVQAMACDLSVEQIASGQLYIHPALSEVVEQALLGLGP